MYQYSLYNFIYILYLYDKVINESNSRITEILETRGFLIEMKIEISVEYNELSILLTLDLEKE